MRIITGIITNGVTLASGDSPTLIGGVITNDNTTTSTAAVYAGTGVYADIRNAGTVGDLKTRMGIELTAASTITNGAPTATHALIEGSSYGLFLSVASTVSNYATIIGGFAGARIAETGGGGKLTNGSTADTTALISGGAGEGISFGEFGGAGLGTVANFGTITSAEFVGVDLLGAGGQVANGSSADTVSLISGYGEGIRVGGTATVSNFGTIAATAGSSVGILGANTLPLTVTNGASGSTTALITGNDGVDAQGSGVITNFATITGTGANGEALHFLKGSTVVNGAATSTKALLQGDFAGVYLTGSGNITNFGKIEGGGVGIVLLAGGTVINGSSADNTALIGTGIDGIDVSGSAATTVTNFGTIKGVDSSILFGGGNDALTVEPGATFIGAVDGGAGKDAATFVAGGALAVSNFIGFEDYLLSTTNAETLTLTNANFADVTGATIYVSAGSPGDTINASAVTGSNMAVVYGSSGADKITAGDTTRMFGGAGANEFIFDRIGSNQIMDFTLSTSNEIVFSNSGFHLNQSGASATPQALPSTLFVSNSAGTFTNTTQRFAYDTSNGELFYDADGSGTGSSAHAVAMLTGHPTLIASDLFFIS